MPKRYVRLLGSHGGELDREEITGEIAPALQTLIDRCQIDAGDQIVVDPEEEPGQLDL